MASSVDEIKEPFSVSGRGGCLAPPKALLSYEEIARKLLDEKLFLTALELHAELCEVGKELPVLREFFSNPNNFENSSIKPEPYTPMPRSSSQATLDSLDMTRYSEDGAGVDERVAILEFELRKARENISALRANLTVVTESESTLKAPDKSSEKNLTTELPIKPHEQRALNFLINEYLLARSYKLTSITFSDEDEDQDFEDWQDVGLNIPKPAELLQIYREYMRANGHDKPPSVSVAVQTDFIVEEQIVERKDEFLEMAEQLERLQQQTTVLEQEKAALQEIISSSNENIMENPAKSGSCGTIRTINSSSTTPDKFEMLESLPRDISAATQEPEEDDSASAVVSLDETDPGDKEWTRLQLPRVNIIERSSREVLSTTSSRNLPMKFKLEVATHCLANISESVMSSVEESLKGGVTRDTLVEILTCTLPRVVPNIILNKREEIVPLILSAIHLHPNSGEREKLLQLLFNLKKRPQEDERQMILAGLIVMVKLAEEPLESEEILTICWEQSQHKYPERRLLAVECCSVLASYTSASIRNSLMLSMLQQMLLEDKDPVVRTSVVRSLALLIALMDDPDKYFQCEELALTALHDTSSMVVETASSVLLPVLAQWALSLKRLHLNLLPRIIAKVKNQLRPTQNSPNKDYIDEEKLVPSVGILQCILPYMVLCVADNDAVRSCIGNATSSDLPEEFLDLCHSNIVDPRVFYEGPVNVGVLLNTFFSKSWEDMSWPELEWFSTKLVFDVLEMVKSVDATHENVLKTLLTYIHSLCVSFGRYITQSKIQAVFFPEVSELEKQLTALSADKKSMSLMLIPSYLVILSTLDSTELIDYFKQFLVILSISGTSISWLHVAASILCAREEMQEHVLVSLWDGVVHPRSSVRCATAALFGFIIGHVSDRLANSRIVPAIVTLASDPEVGVRCVAISSLGRIITECKVREARDKARLTLETIAKDPQGLSQALATSLVSTFAFIAPNCPQIYTEDIIATQLSAIAAFALQQSRKIELVSALVEAYSVLVYCPLSGQCVSGVVVPGLRHLETLVNQCLPQQKDTVRSLLRETESRQDVSKPIERTLSMSSGLSLSMATVNVGQGVEDMRQRMSKIFQQKTGSPSMSSIFRKK
ncbi:PREDICTED: lisH domain and HEAT repeat-containing protein KIAA1468 homolog isoform X2 [Dinoponera quadriceps]|uniref:LisH domain and HEAT repeat-containing protein KIAA1468 homolog isoform X2 n=1 Tax=Dinoponera quadriceps TaxID=609295 RepID=A0A6P3X680_DINQU|nr:PREDICTED: lisH domain and HEAT repeat-containing protein KIAA1468 homolog isoform X2 [Dinoponera quadriceps]